MQHQSIALHILLFEGSGQRLVELLIQPLNVQEQQAILANEQIMGVALLTGHQHLLQVAAALDAVEVKEGEEGRRVQEGSGGGEEAEDRALDIEGKDKEVAARLQGMRVEQAEGA